MQQADFADLQLGRVPDGTWFESSGVVLGDRGVEWIIETKKKYTRESGMTLDRWVYTPVVSETWRDGDLIHVILEEHHSNAGKLDGAMTFTGIVSTPVKPSTRTSLLENGVNLAGDAFIVRYDAKPVGAKVLGGLLCFGGCFMAFLNWLILKFVTRGPAKKSRKTVVREERQHQNNVEAWLTQRGLQADNLS
tara:strand:- start:688408 stop:688983 length:576 start_codon:yes stop_codon:yes gene_type:complete